jgi:hypothetical protein
MALSDIEHTERFRLSVLQRQPGGKDWQHKVTDGKYEVCYFNGSIEEAKRRACDYLIKVLSDCRLSLLDRDTGKSVKFSADPRVWHEETEPATPPPFKMASS